jgi:hypothetical protein
MWKTIARLPLKVIDGYPNWAVKPLYLESSEEPSKTPVCVVQLLHKHATGKMGTDGRWLKPPEYDWVVAKMVNEKQFMQKQEMPKYKCSTCEQQTPQRVVETKMLTMKEHRGIDPRNNRRAAIEAATKKRGNRWPETETN